MRKRIDPLELEFAVKVVERGPEWLARRYFRLWFVLMVPVGWLILENDWHEWPTVFLIGLGLAGVFVFHGMYRTFWAKSLLRRAEDLPQIGNPVIATDDGLPGSEFITNTTRLRVDVPKIAFARHLPGHLFLWFMLIFAGGVPYLAYQRLRGLPAIALLLITLSAMSCGTAYLDYRVKRWRYRRYLRPELPPDRQYSESQP